MENFEVDRKLVPAIVAATRADSEMQKRNNKIEWFHSFRCSPPPHVDISKMHKTLKLSDDVYYSVKGDDYGVREMIANYAHIHWDS